MTTRDISGLRTGPCGTLDLALAVFSLKQMSDDKTKISNVRTMYLRFTDTITAETIRT